MITRWGFVSLAFVFACGARTDLGATQTTGDVSTGKPPAAACDPSRPFGTPVPVAGVDTSIDQNGGTSSADGLTLYFQQGLGFGSYDLFSATRAALGQPFTGIAPLSTLDTPQDEGDPFVAPDQKTIYFVHGTGTFHVYYATRAAASDPFGPSAPVPNVSSSAGENTPTVTADNAYLCFASLRAGGLGARDIWCSVRASDGQFTTPVDPFEINSSGDESGVALSADGLVVYVGSNRPGTHGDRDIWRAERPSRSDPFGAPVNVDSVNSPSWEQPVWVSADDCTLYLDSTRPGGAGGIDIYVATRAP